MSLRMRWSDRWSIPMRLVAAAVAAVIPLSVLFLVGLWYQADANETAQRAALRYTAELLAAAVDAYLSKYIAIAEVLARSPNIMADDLSLFEAEARNAFQAVPNAWVFVSSADGQQLMNMARPPGTPLPRRPEQSLAARQKAFAARATIVSDVRYGPVLKTWVSAIEIPLFKDGQPFRSLTVTMRAHEFLGLLNAQQAPANTLTGIVDSQGRFVARSREHERYAGQLASEGWRSTRHLEGVFEFNSLEGEPLISANARIGAADWTVAVAILKSELRSAAWGPLRWTLILGLGIAALSLITAALLARSISRPIAELRKKAPALLSGKTVATPGGPPEVVFLQDALQRAARMRAHSQRRYSLAQAKMVQNEQRMRLASQAAQLGFYDYDVAHRQSTWSPELWSILGLKDKMQDHVSFDTAMATVHPEDRPRVSAAMVAATRQLAPYELEYRIVRPDGTVRSVLDVGQSYGPIDDSSGLARRVVGVAMDITERKRREEHIQFLLREVNHRAKNLLAVAQSIAAQTAAKSPGDFLKLFSERLLALSANQDLLIANDWQGVDVSDLAHAQLAHFAGLIGTRITIVGPRLRIHAAAAQAIGLALHELATNAAKYGALSTDTGRVELSWKRAADNFEMCWTEHGGPPVEPPQRQGFGSRVIVAAIQASLGGEASLVHKPAGVVWCVSCPAANVVDPGTASTITTDDLKPVS